LGTELVRNMSHSHDAPQQREKMTLMLDADLRQRIEDERRKIEAASGFRVSRTQIVERMVRRALDAGDASKDSVASA
jgi:hypothetical protein